MTGLDKFNIDRRYDKLESEGGEVSVRGAEGSEESLRQVREELAAYKQPEDHPGPDAESINYVFREGDPALELLKSQEEAGLIETRLVKPLGPRQAARQQEAELEEMTHEERRECPNCGRSIYGSGECTNAACMRERAQERMEDLATIEEENELLEQYSSAPVVSISKPAYTPEVPQVPEPQPIEMPRVETIPEPEVKEPPMMVVQELGGRTASMPETPEQKKAREDQENREANRRHDETLKRKREEYMRTHGEDIETGEAAEPEINAVGSRKQKAAKQEPQEQEYEYSRPLTASELGEIAETAEAFETSAPEQLKKGIGAYKNFKEELNRQEDIRRKRELAQLKLDADISREKAAIRRNAKPSFIQDIKNAISQDTANILKLKKLELEASKVEAQIAKIQGQQAKAAAARPTAQVQQPAPQPQNPGSILQAIGSGQTSVSSDMVLGQIGGFNVNIPPQLPAQPQQEQISSTSVPAAAEAAIEEQNPEGKPIYVHGHYRKASRPRAEMPEQLRG